MDEGRLGLAVRREEKHRKFVYIMNDIVRTQLGLYNSCLAREEHEASVKLVKSSVEVKRAIVRQRVLLQCLEMRKRKVLDRDPHAPFGQYGGRPLWTMSRDIDRVIANNHPRLRRMRRAKDLMQKSLQSGAILDTDTMVRRMEAFFQLKQGQGRQEHSENDEGPESSQISSQQKNPFKLPPLLRSKAELHKGRSLGEAIDNVGPSGTKDIAKSSNPKVSSKHVEKKSFGIASEVLLKTDAQGQLADRDSSPQDNISACSNANNGDNSHNMKDISRDIASKTDEPVTSTAGFVLRNENSPPEGDVAVGQVRLETVDRVHLQGPEDNRKKKSDLQTRRQPTLILPPISISKSLVNQK